MLAKNAYAAAEISKLLRERKIIKRYLAILCGIPGKFEGIIESIIKKGDPELSREQKEQYARTKFNVIAKHQKLLSLVKMIPLTGRKHQIRLHSKKIGCSILGDSKHGYYNGKNEIYKHAYLHLHAYSLKFTLLDKKYNLKAELPSHFSDTMNQYFPNLKT